MSEKKENVNIVGMLRDKSGDADLNQVLKSSFGGYTKKSVQEYFGVLRKQQQATQETFQKNLQDLFDEKENIKKSNESLLARYNKLAAEYDNLSESLKSLKFDEKDFSAKDIIALKSKIISLEEETKFKSGEKKSLEKQINQLNYSIDELKVSLKHSNDEIEAQKEMLKAERQESKKLRETIADLSRQLDEEKSEVKFLKGVMTDGKYAELNSKVNELNLDLYTQTELISKQTMEINLKDRTIETLNDEISSLKFRLKSLMQTLENSNQHNDKLIAANDLLKAKLEEEYKKSIELINEKANIHVEKLIAQKNLSNIEARLITIELKLKKQNTIDEIESISVLAEDSE